jgi:hypothetical protein
MAIDTTAKLASALYFVGHRHGRLTPTATISGADLQDIVGFYRGVLAIPAGLAPFSIPFTVTRPAPVFASVKPGVAADVKRPNPKVVVV